MYRTLLSLVLAALAIPVSAQTSTTTSASIVRLGYQTARLPQVAPGQVVHLTLHGLTTTFSSTQVAQTVPLPTTFQGLMVSLQRSTTGGLEPLPLLRLDGYSSCDSPVVPFQFGPGDPVTCTKDNTADLWAQIPFDLTTNKPGSDNTGCGDPTCVSTPLADAALVVSELSGTGATLRIVPVIDQVHILNSCTDNLSMAGIQGASAYATYACIPAITHSDGGWVTAARPAKSGEELVAYAFGLGAPTGGLFPTASGTPAGGVAMSQPFFLTFPGVSNTQVRPDYVGLVGGSAGLYQINFRVPALPASLIGCTAPGSTGQLPTVPFNFSMSLQGSASVDQVSFCAQP